MRLIIHAQIYPMKKINFTISSRGRKLSLMIAYIICSHFFAAQAQPVFTAANCFSLGDSTGIGTGLTQASFLSMVSETGSNYVWDFSANNSGGPWYSWTSPVNRYVFEPGANASQILFHPFPIYENPGTTASAYHRAFSYSADGDTLYKLAESSGGGSNVVVMNPPLPYLSFPMNYQDQGSANIFNLGPAGPVSTTRRTWKYDGFGKIIMPFGVIDSVYRFYTVQVDSILSFQYVSTGKELIWFQKSSGIPVLRFIESGTSFVALYTASQNALGLAERSSAEGISVYPNPCNENISFTCNDNNAVYFIYDMQGRKLMEGKSLRGINTISLEGLNRGSYVLQNGNARKLFLIER